MVVYRLKNVLYTSNTRIKKRITIFKIKIFTRHTNETLNTTKSNEKKYTFGVDN